MSHDGRVARPPVTDCRAIIDAVRRYESVHYLKIGVPGSSPSGAAGYGRSRAWPRYGLASPAASSTSSSRTWTSRSATRRPSPPTTSSTLTSTSGIFHSTTRYAPAVASASESYCRPSRTPAAGSQLVPGSHTLSGGAKGGEWNCAQRHRTAQNCTQRPYRNPDERAYRSKYGAFRHLPNHAGSVGVRGSSPLSSTNGSPGIRGL